MSKQKGFTLVELLVVIAIISVMSSVVYSSLNGARIKARDAKRLADMRQIRIALELYYDTYGTYPQEGAVSTCSGWDTPLNNDFIPALGTAGILQYVKDPTMNNDCGNYAYYYYDAATGGCNANFYVLGIRDLESVTTGDHPTSPGWACTSNWADQFEWVTGGYRY